MKVVKRQESNLTRRSLTKLREATKQEQKTSKNESEDDRSSTNSETSEVADLPNKQQMSHSTILLADVSILFTCFLPKRSFLYPVFNFYSPSNQNMP